MIYLVLFIVFCGLRWSTGPSVRGSRSRYVFLLGFLFLFSAFRFEVGPDWFGYLQNFESLRWSTFTETLARRDPGFWLMNLAVYRCSLPYPVVNVLSSAVFFCGLHVLARRQPDPLGFLILTFPILIINMPMSATRQAMGIGFVCIAFASLCDRKVLAFAFWVFAASIFHSSAFIFMLLVPLVTGEYTNKRVFFAVLLAIPGLYALSLSSEAELAASRYLWSDKADGAIYRAGTLLAAGALYLLALRKRWRQDFPADFPLVSLSALVMLAIVPVVFVSTVIADRLGYYLMPVQAMIFARLPMLISAENRAMVSAAPYLGLLALLLVWTRYSWIFKAAYLPYQTWLFGFPN